MTQMKLRQEISVLGAAGWVISYTRPRHLSAARTRIGLTHRFMVLTTSATPHFWPIILDGLQCSMLDRTTECYMPSMLQRWLPVARGQLTLLSCLLMCPVFFSLTLKAKDSIIWRTPITAINFMLTSRYAVRSE